MSNTDERARLRALAEKATPGAWSTSPSPTGSMYALPVPRLIGFSKADAEYIAALSPPVVLALLDAADRTKAAERERDGCFADLEDMWTALRIPEVRTLEAVQEVRAAADRAEAAERDAQKLRIDTYALFAERDRYRIRAETAERERDALRHDGQPVAWRVSFNQGETWTIYEREPAELHGRLDVLIAPLYDSGAVRVDAYRRAIRERGAERARAEAAERELASVLSDWNTVRDASGSKTNGGLAGHVAQLRARAERLEAALKFYAERNHMYGSMADDWEDCSDQEAAGWLFPPDPVSDESWGVETGLVARAALDAARAGEGS